MVHIPFSIDVADVCGRVKEAEEAAVRWTICLIIWLYIWHKYIGSNVRTYHDTLQRRLATKMVVADRAAHPRSSCRPSNGLVMTKQRK